jgi:hypothetical protein
MKQKERSAGALEEKATRIKKFLGRVNGDTVILWTFLLFSMVLVLTVRLMPASLAVTDDWAAQDIQQLIRSKIALPIDTASPALLQDSRDRLVEKRLAEEIAQNKAQYDKAVKDKGESFRSFLRYDANGKEYTYLGDYDSYFWLRYARNILRHGTVCDVVVDGACKDTYMIAPQGVNTSFNPSLHVFAIYGLYKLITVFSPNYPLPATSFLVPVIAGVLGCIPAFFIGRRLAGNVGGLFAAIVTSMNPLYLFRSMGSDTDVWNVVVPLFIIWTIMKACEPTDLKRRVMYAALCSALVGLHSAIWEGYWFVYLIILLGTRGTRRRAADRVDPAETADPQRADDECRHHPRGVLCRIRRVPPAPGARPRVFLASRCHFPGGAAPRSRRRAGLLAQRSHVGCRALQGEHHRRGPSDRASRPDNGVHLRAAHGTSSSRSAGCFS